MDNAIDKNYYEILEVPTNSDPDKIYQAYLRQKQTYAQDNLAVYSLLSKDECDRFLNLVEEAFEIIGEPEKRQKYDYARGLNQDQKKGLYQNQAVKNPTPERQISKLVARKKFDLEFSVDENLEKEIESTTEFTGTFLKKIREYRNVDIPRLAEMTKISKTYINNIEEENYAALPAAVYIRGFVYQYAKCLKLNPDLVASSYTKRLKA
ncbi:MAG: hypothetical protein DRQ88_06470 [Epsilonproteobacteria bacterium]|nr:MAG: hypothetical protein DRQ89_04820 [Campylobacterota bacterium]RLA66441.1 MAG: hypothetical protein DRQ88_06470 [Campylobacterota bacterium]